MVAGTNFHKAALKGVEGSPEPDAEVEPDPKDGVNPDPEVEVKPTPRLPAGEESMLEPEVLPNVVEVAEPKVVKVVDVTGRPDPRADPEPRPGVDAEPKAGVEPRARGEPEAAADPKDVDPKAVPDVGPEVEPDVTPKVGAIEEPEAKPCGRAVLVVVVPGPATGAGGALGYGDGVKEKGPEVVVGAAAGCEGGADKPEPEDEIMKRAAPKVAEFDVSKPCGRATA